MAQTWGYHQQESNKIRLENFEPKRKSTFIFTEEICNKYPVPLSQKVELPYHPRKTTYKKWVLSWEPGFQTCREPLLVIWVYLKRRYLQIWWSITLFQCLEAYHICTHTQLPIVVGCISLYILIKYQLYSQTSPVKFPCSDTATFLLLVLSILLIC